MGDALTDLIARVEKLEGPDREVDALIECAARWHEAARVGIAPEHRAKWTVSRDFWVEDSHTAYQPSPVTSSLDVALALVTRVLPGMLIENLGEMRDAGSLTGHWLAQLGPRGPRRRMSGPITAENLRGVLDANEPVSAPTPALALLLALLRALQSPTTKEREE